jgi:AcrR family transcriptional regulator
MAKTPTPSEQHTREKLLAAASKVFAEKGFHGATVKQIADAAGCNVSLISYHFDGKEGLFKAILEGFGKERLAESEKILLPPVSVEDMRAKLSLWMNQFLLCHVQDDSVCSILHHGNIMEEEFLWDVFRGTFLKTFEAIVKFLEAAKKKGLVRKDVDPLIATVTLFGALKHIGSNQKLQKKLFHVSIADEKYRAQAIEQILGTLLHGISGSSL